MSTTFHDEHGMESSLRRGNLRTAPSVTQALYRYAFVVFATYLVAALFAFWPRYLSTLASGHSVVVHLHGGVMAAWLGVLAVQAWLIRTQRRAWHRRLGVAALLVAPLVVLSLVGVAHGAAVRVPPASPMRLAQIALQLSYCLVFSLFVGCAMWNRRDRAIHARWMFCTVLIMTSPICDRILAFYGGGAFAGLPQFVDGSRTLPLIHIWLLSLIVWEWRAGVKVSVFTYALGIFVGQHAFAVVASRAAWWERFAAWFATVAIT